MYHNNSKCISPIKVQRKPKVYYIYRQQVLKTAFNPVKQDDEFQNISYTI